MNNAHASGPFVNRRALIWLAWLLLATSVLMPAPVGFFAGDAFGVSAFYVLGKAVAWSEAAPGASGSLGFWREAAVSLAMFSNVIFVCAPGLRDRRGASVTWKSLLLAALAIDAAVAFLVADLTRLPACWVWLSSVAVLAMAFVGFPGAPAAATASGRRSTPVVDGDDGVPRFVWILLGFTLFWIAVSAENHHSPGPVNDATADEAPLTSYLTDHAQLFTRGEATRLTDALQQFEQATSTQVAVAIYRRSPDASIEDFTIRIAERSRLGRRGLDNGVILFVFMDPRAARIEVGYGLEGVLTDVQSHRILETALAPAFAKGAYLDGVDATLAATFGVVKDAYERGRVPGTLAVWWHRMQVEWPKVLRNAWPAIRELGLGARVGITLFGSLLVVALATALAQWIALGRNIARGMANVRAGRSFSDGMNRVDLGQVWESIKSLAWVVVGVVSTAGVVMIAAGGAFGGAGALVHW